MHHAPCTISNNLYSQNCNYQHERYQPLLICLLSLLEHQKAKRVISINHPPVSISVDARILVSRNLSLRTRHQCITASEGDRYPSTNPYFKSDREKIIQIQRSMSQHSELSESEDYVPLKELRNESMTSLNRKLLKQQSSSYKFFEWQPWLIAVWLCHFIVSLLFITFCSISNHGERKYIPVNAEKVADMGCYRGFVDVFSPNIDADGAFACCTLERENPSICEPPPSYFLFARRLSRFPDAWLLPLFPLFLRGAIHIIQKIQGTQGSSKAQITYMIRRFYLFIGLIQIRGWVLYVLFDKIEDLLVSSAGTSCWYEGLLHQNYSSCQGRDTDFSDHIVLYFAQILPIALAEVLHSFAAPFWGTTANTSMSSGPSRRMDGSVFNGFIPIILLVWMANLYFVTFLGAYKTAVYFHTGPEVLLGFLVSLTIQVPLFLLQCTSVFPYIREYFYGHALS